MKNLTGSCSTAGMSSLDPGVVAAIVELDWLFMSSRCAEAEAMELLNGEICVDMETCGSCAKAVT